MSDSPSLLPVRSVLRISISPDTIRILIKIRIGIGIFIVPVQVYKEICLTVHGNKFIRVGTAMSEIVA